MADPILESALAAAVESARSAGTILRLGFDAEDKAAETKAHRHDPVTVYDRRADEAIQRILRRDFPDWAIVSEEGDTSKPASGPHWIIDPLDGTNNFLRGVPDFAVSIGLADVSGPAIACIYDPLRDELFTAIRGEGARRNGEPIQVSDHASLDGAVLGIGLSTLPQRRNITLANLSRFTESARSLRLTGSAALDLAYVAAGRFDATWYLSLHAWDVSAWILLVTEAGGRVSDLHGAPLRDPDHGIVATNGRLHGAMVDAISPEGPA